MITQDTLAEIPYFKRLRLTQPRVYDMLIQTCMSSSLISNMDQGEIILRHGQIPDTFIFPLSGEYMNLYLKDQQDIREQQFTTFTKFPQLKGMKQSFRLNYLDFRPKLTYYGNQIYPSEHLQSLENELLELNLLPIFDRLTPVLFDNHQIRFSRSQILNQQKPLIEDLRKRMPHYVIASKPCQLLILDKGIYLQITAQIPIKEQDNMEILLFKCFEDTSKHIDNKRVLSLIHKKATLHNLDINQVLFSQQTPSKFIYIVVNGEFEISYRATAGVQPEEPVQLSQFEMFKKLNRQQSSVLASERQRTEGTNKYSNKEYVLLKLGPAQLIGHEEFTFDQTVQQNHRFKCRCISEKASVLAIDKSELYKICSQNDWFARILFKRAQLKYKWLIERYQIMSQKEFQLNQSQQPKTDRTYDKLLEQIRSDGQHFNIKRSPQQKNQPVNITTQTSQRKIILRKLIAQNKVENKGDGKGIGMIEYMIKIDRHKQLLLQHQLSKVIPRRSSQIFTETVRTQQSISPEKVSRLKRSFSYGVRILNSQHNISPSKQ